MQSARHLTKSDLRKRLFEQVFDQAQANGKVNAIIIQEYLLNATPFVLVELALGANRLAAVKGLSPSQAAAKLMEIIPATYPLRGRIIGMVLIRRIN